MRELDLHDMGVKEAMDLFVREYNAFIGNKSAGPLKIVHGYGSTGVGGNIRSAVRSMLSANKNAAESVNGEDIDGNPGYTLVYPVRRLPPAGVRLWDSIVEFCDAPKTSSDIVSRFIRHHAERDILEGLRALEKKGRIRSFQSGGKRRFVACSTRERKV